MLFNCGAGEDSWESLDSKKIKLISPKRNQPWIFIGRTDAEAETPMLWPWEGLTHWKRPWCWERLRAEGERDNRGWDGWMASLTQWTWVWASSESWWWTGRPGVLQSMDHKESDTTEQLNWTDLLKKESPSSSSQDIYNYLTHMFELFYRN